MAGAVEAKKEGWTLSAASSCSPSATAGPPRHPPGLPSPSAVPLRVDRDRDPIHKPARPGASEPRGLHLPSAGDPPRVAPASRLRAESGAPARRCRDASALRGRCHPPRASEDAPTTGDRRTLAGADHRHSQPRGVTGSQQATGADPDGDRLRQDLHRGQLRLPAGEVREGQADLVPRRPRQPRPPGPARSSSSSSRPTTGASSASSTSSST